MTLKRILLLLPILLVAWIIADIYWPFKTDLKKIHPQQLATLDGAMWRSYYEKKNLRMFLQTAELIRGQYHVPFWHSNIMAYHVARAAVIFKKGKDSTDYYKALPDLEKYFESVNRISQTPFDAKEAAKLELSWWIIRRYREHHPPAEWEVCLAKAAEAIYHIDARRFAEYAHLRTEAMVFRDEKGSNITEGDWMKIDSVLQNAWASFAQALK